MAIFFKFIISLISQKNIFMLFSRKLKLNDIDDIANQISIKRRNFKIAVIEDNVFPVIKQLKKNDFHITHFKDIEKIDALSDYEIIITDIKGVGKKLNDELQGAHLIKEIKRLYPLKYLIAYSASNFNPAYNKYFKLSDKALKKDTSITEWIDYLDNAMEELLNPKKQWEKTRNILINQGVDFKKIEKLENLFVKSIKKKKPKVFSYQNIINQEEKSDIIMKQITEFLAIFIAELIKH